jgi:hypothetical protein
MDDFKIEIDDLFHETRHIEPPQSFKNFANYKNDDLYAQAKFNGINRSQSGLSAERSMPVIIA